MSTLRLWDLFASDPDSDEAIIMNTVTTLLYSDEHGHCDYDLNDHGASHLDVAEAPYSTTLEYINTCYKAFLPFAKTFTTYIPDQLSLNVQYYYCGPWCLRGERAKDV